MSRIILASASSRRRDILENLKLKFDVVVSDIVEKIDDYLSYEENVEKIALEKALDVVEKTKDTPGIIIAADTMVVVGDHLIGKPKNDYDAFCILSELSGKEHEVVTGVCVFSSEESRGIISHRNTKINFAKLSEEVIWNYINTGEGKDKAGAYAIQGIGSLFVESIEGCYSNAVGLPTSILREMLADFNVNLL